MTIGLDSKLNNYRSLVLAGLGAIGQSILKLGQTYLNKFENVLLLDKELKICEKVISKYPYPVKRLDLEDYKTLDNHLSTLTPPVLLINVCVDIDTVRLRQMIQHLDVGYIDICESRHPDGARTGFTLGMPYTNQAFHGRFPHLICQGCNPGMAEYTARMLIDQMGSDLDGYSVTIFENDQLAAVKNTHNALVSWSPQDLIEEVLIAPPIEYIDGRCIQGSIPAGKVVMTQWQQTQYPAFKVGHEDIWNIGLLEQVSGAGFFYGFSTHVMKIFQEKPAQAAADLLRLPHENEPIQGLERVVVSVKHPDSGLHKTMLWQADHAQTQQEYGINAVQYQTGLSVLMSLLLMQHTKTGLRPGTYNASTLPLANDDWNMIRQLMAQLGIDWRPVANDYVRLVDEKYDIRTAMNVKQSF